MLDFQKLDPFWNLWSKPNPDIFSKMSYPAQFFRNLEERIHFPIKFGISEQIFIFLISKIEISGTTSVKTINKKALFAFRGNQNNAEKWHV